MLCSFLSMELSNYKKFKNSLKFQTSSKLNQIDKLIDIKINIIKTIYNVYAK